MPDVAVEEDHVSLHWVAFVVRLIVRLHSDALSDQPCSVCLNLSRGYSPVHFIPLLLSAIVSSVNTRDLLPQPAVRVFW